MSIVADLHTFQVLTTDAVNTTYTRSGLSFTPQLLIAWTCGRADATDAVGLRSIYRSFGCGHSTSSRWGIGTSSQHNQGNSNTAHAQTNLRLLTVPLFDGSAAAYLIDIDDMSSGQWRLILDATNSPAISMQVSVLALAGLTKVECGQFTEQAGTGGQTITLSDGALTPDLVIFGAVGETTAAVVGTHAQMMIGAGDGTRQGVWFGQALDAQGTSDTYGYATSSECIATTTIAGTTLSGRATIGTMSTGSFAINWSETNGSANRIYNYCAIQGTNDRVDQFLTQTDTSTSIVESGYGFQPAAILAISACRAESTADTLTADDRISIGAAISPSARVAQGSADQDGQNFTVCSSIIEYDEMYANVTVGAGTIEGLMDLTTMDSGGETMIMDDADPTQKWVFSINFGPAATATGHGPLVGGRLIRGTLRNQLAWSA